MALEEVENDSFDRFAHLRQRWENWLTFQNAALAKRYMDGDLTLYARIRLRGGVRGDYITLFKRELPLMPQGDFDRLCDVGSKGAFEFKAKHIVCESGDRENEHGVLILNVELVKLPKEVSVWPVSSLVWLQCADVPLILGREATYFSKTLGVEFLNAPRDWKIGLANRRATSFSIEPNEIDCEEIEGGSNIVNSVSEDRSPCGIGKLGDMNADMLLR
ncbi:MAG TPA: hypothetical protein VGM36_03645, partial [Rhizomicrobium sp.]